jgi:hypothetical protein
MYDRYHSVFPIFLGLTIISFVFCQPARPEQDDLPTAQQVFAKFKDASGGAAWDKVTSVVTTYSMTQGGLDGVDTNTQDVLAGRDVDRFSFDGIPSSAGYDGKRPWSTDNASITQYLDSDDDIRSAVTNSYMISLSFWYENRRKGTFSSPRLVVTNGKRLTEITVTPDGGLSIDLDFDENDMLVRSVEKASRYTITQVYGDFRKIDGLVLPYRTIASTGDRKYFVNMLATSVQINAKISDQDFLPSTPSATDYIISGGEESVQIPFTYSVQHIFLNVRVNGRGPFQAILDTGGRFAISPEFAKSNGIGWVGRLPGSGTGPKTVSAGVAKIKELELGDITIQNPPVVVVPMPTPDSTILIGSEIFKRFAVKVDFDHLVLTLTPLSKFSYVGSGFVTPFHFEGDIPAVAGVLDSAKGDFTIDTGSGNSLDLFPNFVKRYSLQAIYKPAIDTSNGYGIGGSQMTEIARAKTFSVGSAVESNILVSMADSEKGMYSDTSIAGNVGMGFLHRFNLTFDYGRKSIIFEPNSYYNDPDVYERLGATFLSTSGGFQVDEVISGSPAALAGLQPGDEIEDLGSKALAGVGDSWFFEQLFRPVGTVLRLKVKRHSQTMQITVTLRDLI